MVIEDAQNLARNFDSQVARYRQLTAKAIARNAAKSVPLIPPIRPPIIHLPGIG